MSDDYKTKEIPATACMLNAGEFTISRKNETDKSGALRMVARSGQPIEHWFWGRVVHDLSGMRMHKNRLPVDYVHDPKEIIGYLNHFDSETGDLVASGALVPFKDSDRATEIMHKMSAGVPYEASINFGGDGIKVQELEDGEVTEVNGYQFEGPGMVVREWPLRGVAICPYGADMNTESASQFADSKTTIKATVFKSEPQTTEETVMEHDKTDEVAPAEDPKPEELTEQSEQAEAAVEASVAEVEDEAQADSETVESEDSPAEETEAESVQEEQPVIDVELSQKDPREEFKRMKSDFGADIAAEIFELGGDYQDALKLAYDRKCKEAESLADKVNSLSASAGTPAEFSASPSQCKVKNGVHEVFRKGTRAIKE